jgi:acetate kinase
MRDKVHKKNLEQVDAFVKLYQQFKQVAMFDIWAGLPGA